MIQLFHKKTCTFIVMAFFVAFQQVVSCRCVVYAQQAILPVLTPYDISDIGYTRQVNHVTALVQQVGYQPVVLRAEKKITLQMLQQYPVILCPLPQHVESTLATVLQMYVRQGGKLIVGLPERPLDAAGLSLLQSLGLPVTQSFQTAESLALHWSGQNLGLRTPLPKLSSLVQVTALPAPGSALHVVAYWGNTVPAIVETEHLVLFNWAWGSGLSSTLNQLVLAKSLNLLNPASRGTKPVAVSTPAADTLALPKPAVATQETATQETLQENLKTLSQQLYQMTNPSTPALSDQSSGHQPDEQPGQQPSTVTSAEMKNVAKTTNTKFPGHLAVSRVSASRSKDEMDSEVLDTILGNPSEQIPENPAGSSSASPPSSSPDTPKEESKPVDSVVNPPPARQKPFSFLDPESAAEVLQPKFDYGLYSMYLRMLEDYMGKVDADRKTYSQLGFSIPTEEIDRLLEKTRQLRRLFQATYAQGKTQKGLAVFEDAYSTLMRAMSLTQISVPSETRAIWLDRGTIVAAKNPDGLRKQIQALHQAGINLVFFETVNAGFPVYPSKLVQQNPLIKNWDPLQVALEEAHRLNMELHAWVWVFAVGNQKHNRIIGEPDDYPGPILATHPELMGDALQNQQGELISNGQHEYWLSPASPAARQFLISLYTEILTQYAVDGLHLDYIRYPFQKPGQYMGYEPVARKAFEQLTGTALLPMNSAIQKRWLDWKSAQVSSFVKEVSEATRAIRPNAILSAAVFPMDRASRLATIQQEWETWVENGWIDVLNPMAYTRSPERLTQMVLNLQHSPARAPLLYPGIAMHKLDDSKLLFELEALRHQGVLGSTLFASAYLNEKKANVLSLGLFKENVTQPLSHQNPVAGMLALLNFFETHFEHLQAKPLEMAHQELNEFGGASFNQKKEIAKNLEQFKKLLETLVSSSQPVSNEQSLQQLETGLQALRDSTQYWASQALQESAGEDAGITQFFQETLAKIENLFYYWQGKTRLSLQLKQKAATDTQNAR